MPDKDVLRVLLFVTPAAGSALAGDVATAQIEPEFQAFVVDVLDHGLKTVREGTRIDLEIAGGGAVL
jgi:hypothetical protein